MSTQPNESDVIEGMEVESVTAIEAQERAAIDVQIATAKKYPRDIKQVKQSMLSLATLDEETAAECFYTLSRTDSNGAKKPILGPSVRMAEIAFTSYKNMCAGSRVIGNDGKMVTAQAICHDLENNVRVSTEVRRRITNKYGKTYSEDMQIVTSNAACAIALRNAIFKVVPRALINPVYEAAKKVAVGEVKSINERWANVVSYFGKMGKTEKDLLDYLGKPDSKTIDLGDLEILTGLRTSLKDGATNIDDEFKKDPVSRSTISMDNLMAGKPDDHIAVDQPQVQPPKRRGRTAEEKQETIQPPKPTQSELDAAEIRRAEQKAALQKQEDEFNRIPATESKDNAFFSIRARVMANPGFIDKVDAAISKLVDNGHEELAGHNYHSLQSDSKFGQDAAETWNTIDVQINKMRG